MSRVTALRARLAGSIVLGDGALGTYLYEQGHDIRGGAEALVLTAPDAVRHVHAAYRDAGTELLETNTFAANRLCLAEFGLADRVTELNASAVALARAAAGPDAWVSGSIGPVGMTPGDDIWDEAAVRAAYREQIEALLQAGVDALQLETFTNLRVLRLALEEVRRLAGDRVVKIAQMVFDDGARLSSGETAAGAARMLFDDGAEVVGVNCGRGLRALREAVDGVLESAAGRPVSAYPNAGYPDRVGGRTVYVATPAYIAAQLAPLVRRGVRLVGGCCGTTPDTIRAIRQVIAGLRHASRGGVTLTPATPPPSGVVMSGKIADGKPGGFLAGLQGRLPIVAELDPPPHLDWRPMTEGARALVAAGANAISLAENPLASIRLDNFFLGGWLRRETGIQVVCHLTGRDRNLLGLQSALMGAHAAEIEAILAVTGDPTQRNNHGGSMSVYEVNSIGLVRMLAALNRGATTTGRALRGETNFSIGVAFNGSAGDLAAEARRLCRKRDEGARFVMTQPVFDVEHARRVLALTRATGLRVFLGFLPLVSSRLAEYLHHEVPGMSVPAALRERLSALATPEEQERAGLEDTLTLLETLAPELDGVYLITPGNRWRCLLPLLKRVTDLRDY